MALSATDKYEMRMWGIDVDAVAWSDGTKPPAWVKVNVDNILRGQRNGHAHTCPFNFLSNEPKLLWLHTRHTGAFGSFNTRNPSPCSRGFVRAVVGRVFEGGVEPSGEL